MKFWLLGAIIITFVGLMLFLGLVDQQVATVTDRTRYPPPS